MGLRDQSIFFCLLSCVAFDATGRRGRGRGMKDRGSIKKEKGNSVQMKEIMNIYRKSNNCGRGRKEEMGNRVRMKENMNRKKI